uniref:Uncharacterized protein n=1 Tax=Setaria italica TaxID=4555 RepID=K3YB22_SETIT
MVEWIANLRGEAVEFIGEWAANWGEIFESELGISAGLACEGRRRETRGRRRRGSAPCHGRGGLKISGGKFSATRRGGAAREGELERAGAGEKLEETRDGSWVVAA